MRYIITLFISALIAVSATAQTGRISGKVVDKETNESLPFASVVIQGTTTGALTDDNGDFAIENLKPGLYNLQASFINYKQQVLFEIEVTNDRPAEVLIRMEPAVTDTKVINIVGSTLSNKEESPISARTIGTNEIKRNPGGNRDISRAIRSLPGVAAIPSFRNDIVIRGGAANENRFYIDGIEIPNINHFATQGASGGPVGLINVDLIREVEFYSGAFPSARGNALSSVLEFEFKEARKDKYTANFVVGSSDIGVTVEGPTGDKSGLIISARRSYLQGLFSILGLPFLPTYNDFNLKWKYNINDKNQFTVIALGALDQFALNTKLASDTASEDFLSNKYLIDNLAINSQWNYTVGTKWDHFGEKGRTSFFLSRNMLSNGAYKYPDNDESLARILDYSSTEAENKFRVEHKRTFANDLKVLIGGGGEYAKYRLENDAFFFNNALDTTIRVSERSGLDLWKYSGFIQASKGLLNNRIVLSGGVRMDGNLFNTTMSNPLEQVSPRLSLKYRLKNGWSLNANTGIYNQLPAYTILGNIRNGILQNKDARYITNSQVVAGIEYDWSARNSLITLEAFSKQYKNYPISVSKGVSLANLGADFGVIGNEDVIFSGLGRAYGLEFLFQQRFYEGWYGIFSYTFVRSEFTGADQKYTPSSWDSRHLVSITGGRKFGRDWEIGGRFQLSGGLPYTPDNVASSLLIANWDSFGAAQTDWSQINSKRIKAFHQLDVRVDKKYFFQKWSLNIFLDIQNIYGFEALLKPILDVKRDTQGNPVVDPNDPTRYQAQFLDNTNGTILPSIGIIIEL
jgi:outer membrane receptor for ferrienterochelin and colicin